MTDLKNRMASQEGSAGVKVLLVFVVLFLVGNAGFNYIPVAYEGANFRSEMDTAVVKGLAATGNLKPLEIVDASIKRAARDNNVPADAYVEIKEETSYVSAHVYYTKDVSLLPFGIFKHKYEFNYKAVPSGYLSAQ